MPLQLHLVPLAGYVGLMATAAFEDIRSLVIPNAVILGLCVLWPFHLATAPSVTLAGSFGAAGCAAAVFFVGALLFSRGLIGGGDVKLIAAATLWAGPAATPPLLILTSVVGGLLTLFLLSPAGVLITGARRPVFPPATAGTSAATPVSVPYGVAIAAAALIVTIPPNFSG
jgi:prepilin peptidase CpaA